MGQYRAVPRRIRMDRSKCQDTTSSVPSQTAEVVIATTCLSISITTTTTTTTIIITSTASWDTATFWGLSSSLPMRNPSNSNTHSACSSHSNSSSFTRNKLSTVEAFQDSSNNNRRSSKCITVVDTLSRSPGSLCLRQGNSSRPQVCS